MPFKSEKQRKYMWMHHPKIAKRWAHEKGFYGHMTHASIQANEDSVKCIGSGQDDADFPKSPKTAKHTVQTRVFYT